LQASDETTKLAKNRPMEGSADAVANRFSQEGFWGGTAFGES